MLYDWLLLSVCSVSSKRCNESNDRNILTKKRMWHPPEDPWLLRYHLQNETRVDGTQILHTDIAIHLDAMKVQGNAFVLL